MSYQVLARKWRPKNFEELVGQDSARQTLTNALSQGRLYPVLIFTGPRGTGKTSTARIVAKSLRCQNKKAQGLPCDTCEDCLSISKSCHLDVIEIDGASNNGVEAVRELRDKVSYLPSSGDWKIYIIDEVHMLSNSAFNALLKTLEEPPKHVMFLMATTESHKIPATVLSRCQKIDFHLLSPRVIKNQLEKICKKESFSLSESLLWVLARQAQGSLRDAQSLLDQVITFCGAEAQEEDIRKLLGLSDPQILEDCLKALVLGEEIKIISLIAKLRNKNSSPKVFLESLLSSVSHLLFLKKNPNNKPALLPLSEEEIERKRELISLVSYEQLHFLFDMLLKGERELRMSYDSELVLEVLLLRICSASQMEQVIPFSPHNHLSSPAQEKASSKKDSVTKTSPHKKPKSFVSQLENSKAQNFKGISAQEKETQEASTTSSIQEKETQGSSSTRSIQGKETQSSSSTRSIQGKETQSSSTVSSVQGKEIQGSSTVSSIQEKETQGSSSTSSVQEKETEGSSSTSSVQGKETQSSLISSVQEKETEGSLSTSSIQEKETQSSLISSVQEKETQSSLISSVQEKETQSSSSTTSSIQEKEIQGSSTVSSVQGKETQASLSVSFVKGKETQASSEELVSKNSKGDEDSFEQRLHFLDYLKTKDPILSSLVGKGFFKRKSEFEFILLLPKKSYFLKKLEQPQSRKTLEQELAAFLNLKQKAKCFYQLEEHLQQNLKQEKEKQEQQKLWKQAEENPLFQTIKSVFKDGKISSVKEIGKDTKR